jgi:nicotinamide riboside kinase
MEKEVEATAKNLIIVSGPESTGKTSIAEYLANKYNAPLYPEYARSYIINLKRKYEYNDILKIAEYQYHQFISYNEKKVLSIFDTYLIITKVWFLWHSKTYPSWIDDALLSTKGALYLLCAPDIEWEPDAVRENGGETRKLLFDAYIKELEQYRLNYRVIYGLGDARLKNAESFVNDYIKTK